MKALVTGASGFLGKKVCSVFEEKGIGVIRSSGKKRSGFFEADIRDKRAVVELVRNTFPDVIVHTAANIDNDFCEQNRQEAFAVNVEGTKNLCHAAKLLGAKMVFISTEYVFDGEKNAPYTEEDPCSPVNYYGELKAMAEQEVKTMLKNYLILRPGILYGFNDQQPTNNFILSALNKMRGGEKVSGFAEQFTCPVLIDDVANAIFKLLRQNKSGVYHLGGPDFVSRLDFLLAAAGVFGFDENLVEKSSWENSKRVAKKPKKGIQLSIEKAKKAEITLHGVQSGLQIMRSQFPKEWFGVQ